MLEVTNILIGILVLLLGIPIGNVLAQLTKEELKPGKRYFKFIVALSLVGVVFGLVSRDDILLFSFSFIALVTSRSLKR